MRCCWTYTKRRESLFITVNHFFVTFGGLMIVIYLIFLQMDWRKSMVQSAVAVFVLAVIFGLSRVPPRKVVTTESFRKTSGVYRQTATGARSFSHGLLRGRDRGCPLSELLPHCSWSFMDLTR